MNKGKLLSIAMLGAMMFGDSVPEQRSPKVQKRKKISRNYSLSKSGLQQFFYNEGAIWALNQKNADRKAKVKGWTEYKP